jgi:uncharacterized protein (TIGR02246 family)
MTEQTDDGSRRTAFENDVRALHQALLERWNERDAAGMAALFAGHGSMVGFDGSAVDGRGAIEAHLAPIFRDHPTPAFVAKVKKVRVLAEDVALLRAVAGMVPPSASSIVPELNAIQTLVAARRHSHWQIELFQNTPAAFHGRSAEVDALTEELRAVYKGGAPD